MELIWSYRPKCKYYVELSTIDKHLMRTKRYGVNLELQAKV